MSDSQYEQLVQRWIDFSGSVGEAAEDAKDAMARVFADLTPTIIKICTTIYDGFRTTYDDAGAPYGSSDDDMIRWWREQAELHDAQIEAEMLREREQMILDLSARLQAERAN